MVGIVDFINTGSPNEFQTVNTIFSAIGILLVGLAIFCVLGYNIYVNCYTSDTEKFSFKVDYDWACSIFSSI